MTTLSAAWSRISIQQLTAIWLIFLFFTEPISSSAKSVFLILSVLSIIYQPECRADISHLLHQRWCQATFLLFFLAALGCFWSPAPLSERWLVLEKYTKLLYFPILVAGLRDARLRFWALHAFLLAMTLTSLISVLDFWHVITLPGIDADAIFRNHIMTGIMISFSAYITAYYFFRTIGFLKIAYACLTFLFTYQVLFISNGRTGYVIYFILTILLIVQTLSIKQMLVSLVLLLGLFEFAYQFSAPMHAGVNKVIIDVTHYEDNKNTSVGFRLQFHEFAQQLAKQKPLFGHGTGSFTYLFRALNPVPVWSRRLLEPHSQYWLIAVEFGLLGLFTLAFFYYSLLKTTWQLPTLRTIGLAVLVITIIGNLSDSLLFYSGSGYFFILMMALCFGELRGRTNL